MRKEPDAPAPPWGSFKPVGKQRFIAALVKLGVGHGAVKDMLQQAWFSNGPKQPIDMVYRGVKLRLYPWDNVTDRRLVFGSATRDGMELSYLKKYLTGDSVFLDIGANIGYYSCMMAAAGVRRIMAVEPHPLVRKRLAFHVAVNDFASAIRIVPCALGDGTGEVILNAADGDLGSSSVMPLKYGRQQYHVDMMPLSALCEKNEVLKIDALKIDVEGLEDAVLYPFLETAPETLRPRVIIIEDAHAAQWSRDLTGMFQQCGYTAQRKNDSNTIYARTT